MRGLALTVAGLTALHALAFSAGCSQAPGYVPPAPGSGADAGDFSPCDPPCPTGSACVSLRCVTLDAGAARDVPGDPVFALPDASPPGCCPLGRPGCGCTTAGGTRRADGTCRMVCNTPSVGWIQGRDLNGCPFWIVPMLSCQDQDAGPDSATDAITDARVDAALDGRGG